MRCLLALVLMTCCLVSVWSDTVEGRLIPNQFVEDMWSPIKTGSDFDGWIQRRSGSFGFNEYRVFMYTATNTAIDYKTDQRKYMKVEVYRDVELLYSAAHEHGKVTVIKDNPEFWAKATKENASELPIDSDYLIVGRVDKTFVFGAEWTRSAGSQACEHSASAELFAKYCRK